MFSSSTGSETAWIDRKAENDQVHRLAKELRVPAAIACLLIGRGVTSRDQADAYFSDSLKDLPSPFLMRGMTEAVRLVEDALGRQAPVVVYGDYDVDGSTGTALLVLFLRSIGFEKVFSSQPHRLEEGYGLHRSALMRAVPEDIVEQGPLLITVDCGISDTKPVEELSQEGWSVIITDHHQAPAELPQAKAVLNPNQPGCSFPDKGLAGVGVAFYLAMGIRNHLHQRAYFAHPENAPNLKAFLDLVALGSIADMVPLAGVNRILVRSGLEVLGRFERSGLRELAKVSGVKPGQVGADDIGFRLGPRLNAAGRMGSAEETLALLVCEDETQAQTLAEELNRQNLLRKSLVDSICLEAEVLATEAVLKGASGLVIAGEGWHPGVIGIGASRMVDKFVRPTILLAVRDGVARGSGRSIPGLDLYGALDGLRDLFTSFGGHRAAVGMSLPAERIDELRDRFAEALQGKLTEEMLRPRLDIDWWSDGPEILDEKFLALYRRMAPFGQGNPEPIFALRGRLRKAREVGSGHLKFTLECRGASLDGIGFSCWDRFIENHDGEQELDLAFRLKINRFNGNESWQAELVDFKEAST